MVLGAAVFLIGSFLRQRLRVCGVTSQCLALSRQFAGPLLLVNITYYLCNRRWHVLKTAILMIGDLQNCYVDVLCQRFGDSVDEMERR